MNWVCTHNCPCLGLAPLFFFFGFSQVKIIWCTESHFLAWLKKNTFLLRGVAFKLHPGVRGQKH